MGETVTREVPGRTLVVARPISAAERVGKSMTIVPRSYDEMASIAKMLHHSGLLSKAVRSPEAAFAIIVAGAELGMPPMLALRAVNLVDGKVVVAADAQLGAFKRAGGRAEFKQFDAKACVLHLIHPNGDAHTESFSMEDAKLAGLLGKDNWKKYPKAMLRSRVITAGLKSIGFEPVAGMYDPDEGAEFAPEHELAEQLDQKALVGAIESDTTDGGSADDDAPRIPFGDFQGHRYNEKDGEGKYVVSKKFLTRVAEWAEGKMVEARDTNLGDDEVQRFHQIADDAQNEYDRRVVEDEQTTEGALAAETNHNTPEQSS